VLIDYGQVVDPTVRATKESHDGGVDMAQAKDLATRPADLEVSRSPDLAPVCVPSGGDCTSHNDSACCSHYCVYSTNKCK
jgi:hypothetical protein